MSWKIHEIEGIVLIDEIEAQAHSDLQYKVLPKLLKMFPKVQFILTSHSPLFLLGMEKEYVSEGFEIIDMPSGQTITTERFSEFQRSWEYYRQTEAYEKDLRDILSASNKPLVLMEGETDPEYVRTALELLERRDLLDALDIEWVGAKNPKGGVIHTGINGLNNIKNTLEANPDLSIRSVLLLYDWDSNKPDTDANSLSVRSIPKNDENGVANKGIENLLPPELFDPTDPRFYPTEEKIEDLGVVKTLPRFNKMEFCRWVCEERRQVEDFDKFSTVVAILEQFLASTPATS